jgi:hypothetical protein
VGRMPSKEIFKFEILEYLVSNFPLLFEENTDVSK